MLENQIDLDKLTLNRAVEAVAAPSGRGLTNARRRRSIPQRWTRKGGMHRTSRYPTIPLQLLHFAAQYSLSVISSLAARKARRGRTGKCSALRPEWECPTGLVGGGEPLGRLVISGMDEPSPCLNRSASPTPPFDFSGIFRRMVTMMFKKKRRSGRLFKSVPILLIGSDCEGRVFSEATHTVVLSLHGAGVVSSYKLIAEQELILRLVESSREAEIRIVGEIGSQDGRHTYGVAFLDDDVDFWQMDFPMPPSPKERPLELVLECTGCGLAVTLVNGDYEFDVCAIHGGLVRYCRDCEFTTVWKPQDVGGVPSVAAARPEPAEKAAAERDAQVKFGEDELAERTESSAAPSLEQIPLETMALAEEGLAEHGSLGAANRMEQPSANKLRTETTALKERRQRVRAKVSYFACVRSERFGQDVVACIDMSRGGLAFRTKNAYLISTEVNVAVPFSPHSPNAPAIYTTARVMNIAKLPDLQMFRCGVVFLPVARTRAHS